MSGTQSFTANGAVPEVHETPVQTSMPVTYAVDAPPAVYATPVTMAPPTTESPPKATPAAAYRPNTDSDIAAPVVQQSYQPGTVDGVGGGGGADGTAPPVMVENNMNNSGGEEVAKKKRGRPKKIVSDGSVAAPTVSPPSAAVTPSAGTFSGKRGRGRPRGSSRKQLDVINDVSVTAANVAASGPAGVGFIPNIITVKAGEDVLSKLMSFSQYKAQAVCILSANGAISNVTLRQASSSGGTINYEGRFEILSLSGSFLLTESGGQRSRTGGLSVSLAGPDGRVLGGGVAGLLIAASPVQVIVGSFNVASQQPSRPGHNEVYPAQPKLFSGAASMGASPPSRATLSESSGGPASPLNHSAGGYNNSNSQVISNVAWR